MSATDTLDRIPAVIDDPVPPSAAEPYVGRHRRPEPPVVDEFDGAPTTTFPSPVWLRGSRALGKLTDLVRGGR